MTDSLPRDQDGYIELDAIDDDAFGLDLAAIAPVPPLPEDVWDAIVSAAPHVDADAAGIDVDALAGATLPPRDDLRSADGLDDPIDISFPPDDHVRVDADAPDRLADVADPAAATDEGVDGPASGSSPWDLT